MKKNIDEIIDNFSDKKFVIKFLNKNKEALNIKETVFDIEMEIYHKRYRESSKRLIVTYTFKDGLEKKKRTAKIRIFKNNNLAKKSWTMSKVIWDELRDEYKYIARPLNYFDEYDLFVYETADGAPLSEMLKKKKLSEEELVKKIKIATKYLAKLHEIDASNIKVDFLNGYNTASQINSFYNFLKTSRKEYADQVRLAIERVRDGLGKIPRVKHGLIHGDFQIENFIFNNDELKIIDFDFAEINDPLIDIGNFLVQIFYGGMMGDRVLEYRRMFLEEYLKYNKSIDKRFINERINLYIVIAKIRNISYKMLIPHRLGADDLEGIKWDLFRVERRLEDLKRDPISFFKI